MSVLLLDIETTGLDVGLDKITEIGAMVVTDDFKEIISSLNYLLYDESYSSIPPEVEELTGISMDMLKESGLKPDVVVRSLVNTIQMTGDVRAIVAYNAQFDRSFVKAALYDHGYNLDTTPWLCAMKDVKSNYKFKSWKLMHLALDYGVPVDPSELHRAINDVELMRKMLVASGSTVDSLFAYANTPAVYVRAFVKPPWEDKGESTAKAKALGFAFEKCKGDDRVFDKCWVKLMKEDEQKTWEQYPFETKIIGVAK